jgi:hypothetical protein
LLGARAAHPLFRSCAAALCGKAVPFR